MQKEKVKMKDKYVTEYLQKLANKETTRMRLLGRDTWIVTTNIDCTGKAVYYDDDLTEAEKTIQQLKDKIINRQAHLNTRRQEANKHQNQIHHRNMQIKDLKKDQSMFHDILVAVKESKGIDGNREAWEVLETIEEIINR